MKILVVYYSRTNVTRKVAVNLTKELKADIEQIKDVKDRGGLMGYLRSGKEAMMKTPAEIKEIKKDPSNYDLVIIGTPIWGYTMASPIRTYLTANKFKQVAFFCTQGGSGAKRAFGHMAELIGKEPKATLTLLTKDVMKGFDLKEFVEVLNDLEKAKN